ncbi:MAG: TonB-dependent receptor [Gammaproteobacteria bacterium]|nr:TonB-dependent receptor [Gammaproteobacteria bacterium]
MVNDHRSPGAGSGRAEQLVVRLVALLVVQWLAAGPVRAEAQVSESAVLDSAGADPSTIVYGQAFFAQYNVTTAEDILRRIPGISAILDGDDGGASGGDRRGFGSDGDQILVNNRRLAGKSNDISSALSRIQIQNVERVELLRGTTGDIDVRSDGVVVNLILKEGEAATSSGSAMLASQLDDSGWVDLDAAVNYNGEVGALTFYIGLERKTLSEDGGGGGYTRRYRDERYFYPAGELMQIRDNVSNRQEEKYSFAANSTYHFEQGDKLQLNALINLKSEDTFDVIPFAEYASDGNPISSGVDLRSEVVDRGLEWEFGGTYERSIGDSGNVKILSVYTHDETSKIEARNEQIGGAFYEVSRNPSDVLETEIILRGSYYWPLTSSQTIEAGAESARNTLDQTIQVFADLDEDGLAEEIDIFNPSSKVQETRTELFVNHNWTLSDRWTASSSLVAETSKISQAGADFSNKADFDFVKPRLDVRFSPSVEDQWRIKIEKTVSQLDFSNFVPEYNVRDDRFSAGNPNLRPETAWEYEVGYEHRLANDEGVIGTRMYYKDIQDRIENIAVDVDDDGEFDPAAGNIGDATEYGIELTFSIRMARLGAPNLILDGTFLRRETEVTDPFSGLDRWMAQSWKYTADLGLRHDIAEHRLSYGVTFEDWGGANERYEWQEFRGFTRTPQVTAFLEKRFGTRWTVRFDALDITQGVRERTRWIYAEDATDGALKRVEYFEDSRDRRYTLGMTATF